jgi:acylphosphatase
MKHINSKIANLLHEGFSISTLESLNENQINLLYEKAKKIKKEPKEATTVTTTKTIYDPNEAKGKSFKGTTTVMPDGKVEVTKEGEVTEKFESKAQQGLFWAKCNNSKGQEKKKWCDMAKEFSDSTTKKDYKKMPEKKHPEKTVKTKSKKSDSKDSVKKLEEGIMRLIESHLPPHTTKGELLYSIRRHKI